jgi:hypothetical protein
MAHPGSGGGARRYCGPAALLLLLLQLVGALGLSAREVLGVKRNGQGQYELSVHGARGRARKSSTPAATSPPTASASRARRRALPSRR